MSVIWDRPLRRILRRPLRRPLRTLIAADQGISLLPHVLDLASQGIVILPVVATTADLDFHMWAVWQRHLPSHHIKHFVQLLEERVQVSSNGA